MNSNFEPDKEWNVIVLGDGSYRYRGFALLQRQSIWIANKLAEEEIPEPILSAKSLPELLYAIDEARSKYKKKKEADSPYYLDEWDDAHYKCCHKLVNPHVEHNDDNCPKMQKLKEQKIIYNKLMNSKVNEW